jgi:hypothetical protein
MVSRMGFVAMATHAKNTANTTRFSIDAVRHEAQQPAKRRDLAIYGLRRCVFGIHNSLFETSKAPVLRAIAILSPVAGIQRDHGSRRGAGVAIGLVFDEANPAFRLSIVPTSLATVSRLQRSSTCGLRATISQPPHCGG